MHTFTLTNTKVQRYKILFAAASTLTLIKKKQTSGLPAINFLTEMSGLKAMEQFKINYMKCSTMLLTQF